MATERIERRVIAVLAADVADYSRLMGLDEEGTLARLRAHRRELIDPKIDEHGGRIVRAAGTARSDTARRQRAAVRRRGSRAGDDAEGVQQSGRFPGTEWGTARWPPTGVEAAPRVERLAEVWHAVFHRCR